MSKWPCRSEHIKNALSNPTLISIETVRSSSINLSICSWSTNRGWWANLHWHRSLFNLLLYITFIAREVSTLTNTAAFHVFESIHCLFNSSEQILILPPFIDPFKVQLTIDCKIKRLWVILKHTISWQLLFYSFK